LTVLEMSGEFEVEAVRLLIGVTVAPLVKPQADPETERRVSTAPQSHV
jgi:hypothetical protein